MHLRRDIRLVVGGLAVLLAGAGCSSAKHPVTASDIAGTVVLESYSVSLTWDYRLAGMYIDGDGGVWAYEQHGTPWYPEKLRTSDLTERDMLTKHKGARRIGSVDVQTLVDMANLIAAAGRGRITRAHPELEGNGSLDVAYTLDSGSHTYTAIVLAGSGDLAATNDSGEARTLIDYLREVEAAVGYR